LAPCQKIIAHAIPAILVSSAVCTQDPHPNSAPGMTFLKLKMYKLRRIPTKCKPHTHNMFLVTRGWVVYNENVKVKIVLIRHTYTTYIPAGVTWIYM